jgi:predicted RNA-binding protein with PUA-like domain
VDLVAKAPLPRPFSLAEAKEDKALAGMSLITSFRLSVQPVTADEWNHIMGVVAG